MAKYYSGITTGTTLDSMLASGSEFVESKFVPTLIAFVVLPSDGSIHAKPLPVDDKTFPDVPVLLELSLIPPFG